MLQSAWRFPLPLRCVLGLGNGHKEMKRGTAKRLGLAEGFLPLVRMTIGLVLALMTVLHDAAALSIEPMEVVVRGHVAAIELTRRTPAWVSMRDEIPVTERAAFVDQHYRITLIVDAVEQGKLEQGRKQIEFSGWCMLRRPPDWPSESQVCKAPVPKRGDVLRVHLKVGIDRLVISSSGYELLGN